MRRRFRKHNRDPIEDAPTPSPPTDEGSSGDGRDGSVAEAASSEAHDGDGHEPSFDALLARQLDRMDDVVDPLEVSAQTPSAAPSAATTSPVAAPPETSSAIVAAQPASSPAMADEPQPPGDAVAAIGDFWDHYDRAAAESALAIVPPAAITAVVGPLDAVVPVVRRCRARHWIGRCDVFVLTQLPMVPGQPDWTVVGQPSELVAVLDEGGSDFPLLVLDVPTDLPAFVRPLVARLRDRGVGMVHYVLDGDPVDEDLATWYGELGQPAVLDLAAPVPAGRVLELFDRGEPVVSVAGCELTTELLLALRIQQAVAPG